MCQSDRRERRGDVVGCVFVDIVRSMAGCRVFGIDSGMAWV